MIKNNFTESAMLYSNNNNSTINEEICVTSYSGKKYLTDYQRYFMVLFDVLLLLANLLANVGVLVTLLFTKLLHNTSFLLLFYLSVSDCCLALITQPLFAVLICQFFSQSYCNFEIILQFSAILFTRTSGYTIAVIGFDRYARMRFLNRYTEIINKAKVYCLLVVVTALSICQSLLYVMGTKMNMFIDFRKIAVTIDFIMAFAVLLFHTLTIRALRNHRKNVTNNKLLKDVDKAVTSLASKILFTVVMFYSIYVFISVLHFLFDKKVSGLAKSWLNFALIFSYLIVYCNSFVNAILFLTMNKRSKQSIIRFLTCVCYSKKTTTHCSKYSITAETRM